MLSWVFDVSELSICGYKAEENIGLLLAFSISSSDPACSPWSVKENSGRLCQKWQPIESGWTPSRFTGGSHHFRVFFFSFLCDIPLHPSPDCFQLNVVLNLLHPTFRLIERVQLWTCATWDTKYGKGIGGTYFFWSVSFDCFLEDEWNNLERCINVQFIFYIRVRK